MSTTNRRDKRAITKKEETTANARAKNYEPPKILHPDHFRQLEIISRDVENAKLRMALEEQSLVNMELQLRLLSSNIEKQRVVLQDKAKQYELSKSKFVEFKKEIWPQYGLNENDGLGYDPLTGQIK